MFFKHDSVVFQPFSIQPKPSIDLLEYRPELIRFQRHLSNSSVYRNHQLSYVDFFQKYQHENRALFHLTITYTPYQDRDYRPDDVNKFFSNFYVKSFLPLVLNTRNIHTNAKKSIQPVTFAFLDEHSYSSRTITKSSGDSYKEFADRLHHHAILAIHPETLDRINQFIGLNTFPKTKFSNKVMSTDFKECDAATVLYASKMIDKYPDPLMFPDSFKRHHNRIPRNQNAIQNPVR